MLSTFIGDNPKNKNNYFSKLYSILIKDLAFRKINNETISLK